MYRMVPTTAAAAAKRYYTDGLSRGDYYAGELAAGGLWGGKAAERLGLSGAVKRGDFVRLCENRKPDGSKLTERTKASRRVGYDLNFHCPKSVSIIFAFTGDTRIPTALREAVHETMCLVEAASQTRVRKGGRSGDRLTGNLVWAMFLHDTARPVAGVPDPHWHAHCFVFNATFDPVEGLCKAVQLGNVKANAPYYEACFHSALAWKLRSWGYGIERYGRFWEVAGVPRSLVEKFSRRTQEIEETAERLGIRDADRKAALGALTRGKKSDARPWPEVLRDWNARIEPSELAALQAAGRAGIIHTAGPSARESLEYAWTECVNRSALVSEKLLLEAALRYGVGYVRLNDIVALLPELGKESREIRGERFYVDESRFRDEKDMVAFARETRGTVRPFFDDLAVPNVENSRDRKAVEHLFRSQDRVGILRVEAATCDVVVAQLQAGGYDVRRIDAGVENPSVNIPSAESIRQPSDNPVWWLDQAQRLGVRDLAELFRRADAGGILRVILAAAPGRVSPHNPLLLLRSRAGLRTPGRIATAKNVAGQKEAARLESQGRPLAALSTLDGLGAVREVAREQLVNAVAEEYVRQDRKRGTARRVRVVVEDASLSDKVTQAIRTMLRKATRLGRERTFEQLRKVHLKKWQRRNPSFYQNGQIVVFFKAAKGFRKGHRYQVIGKDPFGNVLARHILPPKGLIPTRLPWVEALPLSKPDHFAVFERSEVSFAKGDWIHVTMGGKTVSESFGVEKLLPKGTRATNQAFADALGLKTPDRRYRMEEGTFHRIKRFTLGGHIQLSNGWVISKRFGHFEHGFAIIGNGPYGRYFEASISAQVVTKERGKPESVTLFTCDKNETMKAASAFESASMGESRATAGPTHTRAKQAGRDGRESGLGR